MKTLHPCNWWRPGFYTSSRSPLFLAVVAALLLASCSDTPVMDNLASAHYPFTTEAGNSVVFPHSFAGKILVVSYIYTHCPDICIVTTSNLDSLRRLIGNRGDVLFLSISLDPRRDTPAILGEYADVHEIDTVNWHLLSGPEASTDSLLARIGFVHRKSFTSYADTGEEVYFINHSDFITVLDQRGRLRGKFSGTEPEMEDVAAMISTLAGETQ